MGTDFQPRSPAVQRQNGLSHKWRWDSRVTAVGGRGHTLLSACVGAADAPRSPKTTQGSLRNPGFSDVTQQRRGAKAETGPEQRGPVTEAKGRRTRRGTAPDTLCPGGAGRPRGAEFSRSPQSPPRVETGQGPEQTFLPRSRAEGRQAHGHRPDVPVTGNANQIHRGTPPPAHVPRRRGQRVRGLAPVRQPLTCSDTALARGTDRAVLSTRVLPRAADARAQSSGGHRSPGTWRVTRSDRTVHTSLRAKGARGGHDTGVHVCETS